MTVAKALEGANLVWQRVNEFMLANPSQSMQRAIFLRDVKGILATQKGNPKLQFLTVSNPADDDLATVPELSTGGCTLYAFYGIKQNTATAAYFGASDSATLSEAGDTNQLFQAAFLVGKDEVSIIFQPGLIVVNGIRVYSDTTQAGGTGSTSGDGPNCFFVVG